VLLIVSLGEYMERAGQQGQEAASCWEVVSGRTRDAAAALMPSWTTRRSAGCVDAGMLDVCGVAWLQRPQDWPEGPGNSILLQ